MVPDDYELRVVVLERERDGPFGILFSKEAPRGTVLECRYFWLKGEGLAPSKEMCQAEGLERSELRGYAEERLLFRAIYAFAIAADKAGNPRLDYELPYAFHAEKYGRAFNHFFEDNPLRPTHGSPLRKFFGSREVFIDRLLERPRGKHVLRGKAIEFRVAGPEELFPPRLALLQHQSSFEARVRPFQSILELHDIFGGRKTELGQLDEYLKSEMSYCFVTGLTGTGKTALLVNWAQLLEPRGYHCIPHFISPLVNRGTDERALLENICAQLSAARGIRGMIPHDDHSLRDLLVHLLERDAPVDRQIVVVVDGLDEALGTWTPDATLFPRRTGRGIHVVLSARRMADKDWPRDLGLDPAELCTVELLNLSRDEIIDVLPKTRLPENLYQCCADRLFLLSEGDPFYLRELLRDLESAGWDLDRLQEHPIGANAYLRRWWRDASELCGRVGENAFVDLMGTFAVARAPVGRDVLLALSKRDAIRGATFDRLTRAAGRFLIGDAEGGYQLAHRRVAEFAVQEMSDEIDRYRQRFAGLCLRWHEPGLSERVEEYALRYAAAHLREAGRAEELLSLICLPWLQRKRRFSVSPADFIGGLDEIIGVLVHLPPSDELFAKLIALARWKQLHSRSERSELLGVELALEARRGGWRRALSEADQFGGPDDRLLTMAEAALAVRDSDPVETERLLLAIASLARSCRPDTVEAVAVRVAGVAPKDSIALARTIPEENEREGFVWEESPSPERCLFRVFRQVAQTDEMAILDLLGHLVTVRERAHAAVGALSHLVAQNARSPVVADLMGRILAEETLKPSRWAIAKYLFWKLFAAPAIQFVAGLERISAIDPFLSSPDFPVSVVDTKLQSAPAAMAQAIAELPSGEVRTFLLDRLARPNGSGGRSEVLIARLARETAVVAAAQLGEITGLAAVGLATLSFADHVKARASCDRIFAGLLAICESGKDWTRFRIGLEILRRVARQPGELRNRVVRWCIDAMDKVTPTASRADAERAFGEVARAGLSVADRLMFPDLRSIVDSLPREKERLRCLEAVVCALPGSECARLMQNMAEEMRRTGARPLLLPPTLVRFLGLLAEASAEPMVGHRALMQAVEHMSQVEEDEQRWTLSRQLFRSALHVGADAAVELCRLNVLDSDLSIRAIGDFLEEQPAIAWRLRDQWVRTTIRASLMPPDQHLDRASLILSGRAIAASKAARTSWVLHSAPAFDSQGLLHVLEQYGEREHLGRLAECARALAEIDWPAFMRFVRHPLLGRHAVDVLRLDDLRELILSVNAEPNAILQDIRDLRHTRDRASGSRAGRDSLHDAVMTLAAVHDPQLCAELLANCTPEQQSEFCDGLERKEKGRGWTDEGIQLVVQMVRDPVARARFLQWVARDGIVANALVDCCVADARRSGEATALAESARLLAPGSPQKALAMWVEAADAALASGDTEEAYGYLKEAVLLVDTDNQAVLTVGERLTRLRSPETLLRCIAQGATSSASDRFLESLGRSALVAKAQDLELWQKALDGLSVEWKSGRRALTRALVAGGSQNRTGMTINTIHGAIHDQLGQVLALVALAEHAPVQKDVEASISEACRTAESLPASADRADAFESIALYAERGDPDDALQYSKRVIVEASQQQNPYILCACCWDVAARALRHADCSTGPLTSLMQQVADVYPFQDGQPPLYGDGRAQCLLFAVLAAWRRPEFEDAIRRFDEELAEVATGDATHCGIYLLHAFEHVAKAADEKEALTMIDAILVGLRPETRRSLVRSALQGSLYTGTTAPLADLGVYTKAYDHCVRQFIEHLAAQYDGALPWKASFKLSLSYAKHDEARAREHLARAVEQLDAAEIHEPAHEVWLAHAGLHGPIGWLRACKELVCTEDPGKLRLRSLLSCACAVARRPGELLRDVLQSVQGPR